MNYSSERIIKNKVGLLNLAEELGNISRAVLPPYKWSSFSFVVGEGGCLML
jgi:hypothetical protein